MNATPQVPHAPMLDAPSRRRFLQQSALLTAGLAVGFRLPDALAASKDAAAGEFEPNAWVRVLPDNTVKIVVHKHDSGTGTQTALAACVAEELDVDPMRIAVITPEDPFFQDYIHPIWKVYSTGGSTSVSLEYARLRQAGATARAMLVSAAAQRWGVPVANCRTADGTVLCADGRKATYGELADAAGRLAAPANVVLKNPADFKYIGKLRHKRDAAAKASGRFQYGIDVALPGMLVAVVQRAPMPGARVRHIDSAEALKVRGVRQVITIPLRSDVLGGNQEGVAVLADDYWAANKGRAALKVEWDDSAFADFDSGHVAEHQAAWLASGKARVVHTVQSGNTDAAIAHGVKRINAAYRMPYKQQNPLEPVNITAWLKDGVIQYWGGIQVPSTAMEAAETICGLPRGKVVLHEMVSGGSFGARESKYWLFEVSYLAKKAGVPVKLMNSREDEMRALYGHPATYHQLEGALDTQGRLDALRIRAVSPASPEQWEPGYFDRADRMDYSTTEAISKWDFPYRANHMDIGWVRHETGIPTGWYRAVSFIPNVFATESFMDELAAAAKRDPVEFRVAHMADRPRHVEVLRTAVQRAGWGKTAHGHALGVATHQAYDSYIAVVAQVARKDGRVVVEKLTCVADVGLAVSRTGVEEQLYGGLMWGLGHALFDRIDIQGGAVQQSNFHDYPVMRMSDMPAIEIVVVDGNRDKPGGVGELANPPVAPAIANAIFRLTGKRQRETPFKLDLQA
ncbi:xanthine dehydrogenase family protein molybdopterin-binding subunit [Ralstonia flaminis]|jgi:isoquinoline 1-oxidoreductase beta subunit|uniref:Isoquinoline 1-oxidoreductase subunit beta n=1 Tax=Ralstonia flaminis TaxID=3058597 RepID=A0ABN9JQ53_9RALS|nr:molybdopterin cofactor-binding domain-containing protein [Ralstonia sp. LMG 18101]CAJ0815386.1 Isoquinoline 1-oxidoreductase subunit beta [Ralstonia sp. LMG 18101]